MKMKFTAVGDFLPQRRWPGEYDGFAEVRDFIERGDVRFFNLETMLPDHTCYGNQFYGGAPLRADPGILDDARRYGFNMLSFANNHTLDYSYEGLLKTLEHVNRFGFPNAGVGRNLDEAAAPAYLETVNGSAGLIAAVSTMMNPAAIAGRQSRRVPGRPGVNGLRFDEKIVVTQSQFDALREIADKSCINAQADISRAEGFTPPLPEGVMAFQAVRFQLGEETAHVTHPNQYDMERILKAIHEANIACDHVIVSLHSHEVSGSSKEAPADFVVEFAHNCIDAGACAVLGHGPHILRPLEIYKGRPIFYSLGNFVFQEELTPYAHEDMFEKYGLTSDSAMRDMYQKRTQNFKRGLMADPKVFESVIPYFEVEEGAITKLELMPISLGFDLPRWQAGLPRSGRNRGIIQRYAALSEPLGTKITEREDGIGVVAL